jgi:hypothetical protein
MIKGEFKKRFDDLWDGYEFNVSKLDEIMDEAHKEFEELVRGDPLDWIHHCGEKMESYKKLILKWFGEVKIE